MDELRQLKFMCGEAVELEGKLIENYLVVIAFSHMALEAYLNDYCATCLSDDVYYDHFDGLKTIDKLNLVATFMLNTKIDKGKNMYYLVSILNKRRNELVHSKSKGLTKEDLAKLSLQNWQESDFPKQNGEIMDVEIDLTEAKDRLGAARDALKALMAVAEFIDEYDKNAYAKIHFFMCGGIAEKTAEETHVLEVYKELGVSTHG